MPSEFEADHWVAIVDDDESIRRALARLLRAHGIEAQTFASPRDYLERVDGMPVCLCIDLHLRDDMNGFEFAERLRSQGVSAPIIFITGQDERESAPMMRSPPLGAILRKPLDARRLIDLILEYMRIGANPGEA